MGTRLDNFKSKFAFSRKGIDRFSDEINYDNVFKNQAVLMKAYGTVLKNSLHISDIFCRNKFVESHIYKKLRLLRNIYLVEIAALYGSDNNALRSTLKKSVEDIDTLQSNLFYFPIITAKGVFYIITSIIVVIVAAYPALSTVQVNWVTIYRWLVALGLYSELVLFSATFSFIDKRLLFIFPEYKPQGLFDKCKKRLKAFLGKNIEGTVYEKENKLFNSLKMIKVEEPFVDAILLSTIILVVPMGISLFGVEIGLLTYNQLVLIFLILPSLSLILTIFLRAKRKAK